MFIIAIAKGYAGSAEIAGDRWWGIGGGESMKMPVYLSYRDLGSDVVVIVKNLLCNSKGM